MTGWGRAMRAPASGPVAMSTLDLQNVSLHYGPPNGAAVLGNVSLSLSRGDFVTVIGRSGSGKTSLLNLAAGFVSPTSG